MPIDNKEFTIEQLTIMCKNVEINLNGDDISDLIFVKQNQGPFYFDTFYNVTTRKKSMDIKDVIREGKSFVVAKRSLKDVQKKHIEHGFYVHYAEELDMLIVVNAELRKIQGKWKWVEIERFFFTRDLRTNFEISVHGIFSYDICGQTAYIGEKSGEKIMYLENLPVSLRKKAVSFFGGFVWNYEESDCNILRMSDFYTERDFGYLKYFSDPAKRKGDVVAGILEYGCEGMEIGDVPQSFVNRIKEKALDKLHRYFTYCCKYENRFLGDCEFDTSYLQQVDGCYVQRCFRCVYDYKYPLYRSDVMLVEYLRVKIDLTIGDKGFIRVPLDGCAIDKNICLGHVTHLISKFDTWYKKDDFTYKSYLLPIMIQTAACSLFEKLLNLNVGEASRYYQKTIVTRFINYIDTQRSTAIDFMQSALGDIDTTQTELHKALGIPKGLLEYVVQQGEGIDFENIKTMKYIFKTDKEYLKRMDSASYKCLYDSVDEIVMTSLHPSLVVKTIANLVFLFGSRNWKGYVAHMKKLPIMVDDEISYEYVQKYGEYIKKLAAIKECLNKDFPMQWKLQGDRITEAITAINDTYNIVIDENEYGACLKKFSELYDTWKEYEYEGIDYLILAPKKPSELVNEGFCLNHCAKSFVDAVANNETMVLFIRKKSCPDKPFYTLEIRHRAIRQCHGYNNANIDVIPGLEGFLRTYCNEKQLAFYKGNSLLQV